MILTSKDFYNQFSSQYPYYSRVRENYLKEIDQLIIHNGQGASSLIDIGCGYGDRSLRIGSSLNIERIALVDNSDKMISHCNSGGHSKVILDVSTKDFKINEKYDLVMCLWNVLGHIDTYEKRIIALKNMKNLLTENGRIYIDVNNRYNVRHYGLFSVIRNILRTIIYPRYNNGNFLFQVKNNETTLRTEVHIFTASEMSQLAKDSGLKVLARKSIDYDDGTERNSVFEGQLFFVLSK